jgi:hypothetical protein
MTLSEEYVVIDPMVAGIGRRCAAGAGPAAALSDGRRGETRRRQ